MNPELTDILKKVEAGERLSFDDGVQLFRSQDIFAIGRMASIVRERLNNRRAYYVVNHHINYSNICKNACKFCAFSRKPAAAGAYQMSLEEIYHRGHEAAQSGAPELHIVGGTHPDLPLDWYLDMLSGLKERFPELHLQAFTAVEIAQMAEIGGLTIHQTLQKLIEAGLGSIPGGGAEVFSPRVRAELCPEKLPGEKWLEVMQTAHALGLKSNATMLYGHIETFEERVEHLLRLRSAQDESGGFQAFIPLSFHPENTSLDYLAGPGAVDDLKTLAISRLLLDNFPHIKAFWIMLGVKLSQVSLFFGADDLNGTVVYEKITHSAGAKTPEHLKLDEIVALIVEAGFEPVERDTIYNLIERKGIDWHRIEDKEQSAARRRAASPQD
jgi:aminodeoxyfutalosine synthase